MSHVASKTLQVMSEIERRSLCFSKHLEVYREHGMPWMATALQRLPKAMKGGLLLNTLTFISCVALARLQQLLIQEKFTLDKVRNLRIWSLHPTVYYKLQKQGIPIPSLRPPPPSAEKECVHPLEDVQAVDDQDELRPPVVSAAKCLPANSGQRWGMDEESIISKQSQVTHQVAYQDTFMVSCFYSVGRRMIDIIIFEGGDGGKNQHSATADAREELRRSNDPVSRCGFSRTGCRHCAKL
ncbi:unnamed protein product [Arctogadus glacialis]